MAKTVAIIGASADRRKFGNKAVRAFRDCGWTVYPVNARATEIEGLRAFPSVSDVPDPLDCVSMYVSPAIGKTLIDEIAAKAPAQFFLNPGAGDAELISLAESRGLNAISACSILYIGRSPSMYSDH